MTRAKKPPMYGFQQQIHQIAEFIRGMRWVSRIVAGYCMVMGFTIVFAGDPRFSAVAYQYFREMPGSPDSWGVALIICGIIMTVGISMLHDRVTAVGVALAALWSGVLCWSFVLSALTYPEANLTAIVVYGKDAITYLIYALVLFHYGKYRKDTHEPPDPHHPSRGDAEAR